MPHPPPAVPADPFADGIAAFGRQLRRGETTVERAVTACLVRIAAFEPRIGAFEHVAGESALAAARALDGLLASGTDLGPLMGVPVALKDLIAVRGMPTTCGSDLDATDIVGPEGTFVGQLRRAGCVVLGKAKTIEFAFGGAGGINTVRGTPWNPWDAATHRGCGGSSSGSAAAVAAGLAGFAIGSDTGGSVRLPGAFCGLFGLKPTTGTWPTDGVFPLCPTLDTLGPLTRSAADAALILEALGNVPPVAPVALDGLRLGVPTNQFVDEADTEVAAAFRAALASLRDAGARIDPVTVPEAGPPEAFFHAIVPAEFLAAFGRERFLRDRAALGADIARRAEAGLALTADAYIGFVRRHRELARRAHCAFAGFDAWITPTVGVTAPPVDAFGDVESGLDLNVRIGRFTRPVNIYGLCAATTPIRAPDGTLPVGLQLIAPSGADAALLGLAMAVETHLGHHLRRPDMAAFAGNGAGNGDA